MLYCNNNSRIADMWRPRTRNYAHTWSFATIPAQLERVRPSSQDNTQHSRRQILTSPADLPCAFFTCRRRRLPCPAAKSSQMILLVHDHWRMTDSIIDCASCRLQESIQHTCAEYILQGTPIIVHPTGSTKRGTS